MSTVARSPESARLPAASELIGGAGVGGLVVAALLSPAHIGNGPVLCPFRLLTGLPCPGCGLTRSWVYLVHGDIGRAVVANPFGPVSIAAVLALAVAAIRARVRREPPPDLDSLARRPWVLAVFAAWLLFGAVRIAVDLTT
jgi:hypothetical protein